MSDNEVDMSSSPPDNEAVMSSPDSSGGETREVTIFNARIPAEVAQLIEKYDLLSVDCTHMRNEKFLRYVVPECLREIQKCGGNIAGYDHAEHIHSGILFRLRQVIQQIEREVGACDYSEDTDNCIFAFLSDICTNIAEVHEE